MKKFCITFLLSGIIILTAIVGNALFCPSDQTEFLRIHIRADSNDSQAQEIKYVVRDCVVEYLTPLVATANSKADAVQKLQTQLSEIERVANRALAESGFSYRSKAELKRETFPARVYGEYTLPSGTYDSLIIYLGEGKGENWWCVVYPPLCFSNTPDVRYKSIIVEKIEKWKEKRKGAGTR